MDIGKRLATTCALLALGTATSAQINAFGLDHA